MNHFQKHPISCPCFYFKTLFLHFLQSVICWVPPEDGNNGALNLHNWEELKGLLINECAGARESNRDGGHPGAGNREGAIPTPVRSGKGEVTRTQRKSCVEKASHRSGGLWHNETANHPGG